MEKELTPNHLLRMERDRHNWTQQQLGERIGVDAQTVRSWERGKRSPSKEMRSRLCELFKMSPEQLGLCLADGTPSQALTPLFGQLYQSRQGISFYVRTLTIQQIHIYLTGAGSQSDTLREALHEGPDLLEMARSPLFLSVVALVCRGEADKA
jgi:transcriptional regulator with XRE-family HTH domain